MIKGVYWHEAIAIKELSYELFKFGHFVHKPATATNIFLAASGGLYFFATDWHFLKKSLVFYGKESLTAVQCLC